MKIRVCPWGLLLALVLALGAALALETTEVHAQNRGNGELSSQQNQQGGLGQGTQTGFGGAAGQTRQFSPTGLSGQQQNLGQQPGQQPGVRQNGFIGSSAEQIRNQLRNQNPQQSRQAVFNFAIESLNELRESRRQRQAQRNAAPPVRVHLRPLFSVPQPTSAELTARVRSQLSKAMPDSIASPQVSVSQGTVTLQGQVKSNYDRQLMEKMASLQPGVSQVENRLTIEPRQGEPEFLLPLR